jgi:hypothetical protein
MLSRKPQTEKGITLPSQWTENVESALREVYAAQIEDQGKDFEVAGLTYPDELFLSASFLDPENQIEAPISFMISLDLTEKTNPQDMVKKLIDSIGVFYDGVFAQKDWSEYVPNWTEANEKGIDFFYMVSRENVGLTIKANELLGEL